MVEVSEPIGRSRDEADDRPFAGIERHVREIGFNYLLTYLFLGNMTFADASRSLALFSTEVMPHLETL